MLTALRGHPLLQPRGELDSAAYVALAQHPTSEAYFVSPLYIYFLRACGVSFLLARILQIVLGSIGVVFIFDMARRWFGERAALIAAGLAILTGVLSFYEVTILQTALDPFLTALTLWLLSGTQPPAAAGLALGLLVLNRPNAILLIPVLIVGLWRIRGLRVAGGLIAGLMIAIAPVTLRNTVVAHRFVPVASHGGLNFYIGNNPAADGTYHHVDGVRPTIEGQQYDAPRIESRDGPFDTRAWRWIGSHPGDAARLFLRKLAYTINQADLSLNYSYVYFSRDVASPLRFLIVGPWLLFPLGFAGMVRKLRDGDFAVWASFVPVYAISVAMFFVSSRYRLPLLVPMCVCAGGFFIAPRLRDFAVATAVAIVVLWNFGLDQGRAHERTNMAVYLIEQRQFDDARQLVDQTEAMTRDPVTLHTRAAMSFAAAGDRNDALAMFVRLAADRAQDPNAARVARALGVDFVQANEPSNAMRSFEAAHALEPTDASDLLNLAVLHAQQNDIETARRLAEEALRMRPGYPQAEGLLRAMATDIAGRTRRVDGRDQ